MMHFSYFPTSSTSKKARALTTEKRPVEGELLGQVFDICDALVHGPGEVVSMVKAAQDYAGEVDWLCEVAHQGALDAHHVPPAERKAHELHNNFNVSLRQF